MDPTSLDELVAALDGVPSHRALARRVRRLRRAQAAADARERRRAVEHELRLIHGGRPWRGRLRGRRPSPRSDASASAPIPEPIPVIYQRYLAALRRRGWLL